MTRRLLSVATAVLLAVSLGACAEEDKPVDELRAAIGRTEDLARRYVYVDEPIDGPAREVRGLVEDDFRYKAQLAIAGQPAYEEVVSDDTIAARLLDPAVLELLRVREAKEGTEAAVEALRQQRWVVDPVGAPNLLADLDRRQVGDDPILDSLGVFQYLRLAITEAKEITRFNPESPSYRPKQDPFPHPEDGVIRYDLARHDIPRRSEANQGAGSAMGRQHFRKMSVYVKDGRIVEIREVMDIQSRIEDLEKNFDVSFKGKRLDEAIEQIVKAVNVIRTGNGLDPFRPRSMRLVLEDADDDVDVALPTEGVEAALGVLRNRGREALAASEAGDREGGATADGGDTGEDGATGEEGAEGGGGAGSGSEEAPPEPPAEGGASG